MSSEAQSAELVIRLALQGMTAFVKITGQGAMHIAAMLKAAQEKPDTSPGMKRLKEMLKSGEELKVFTLPESSLKEFALEAKRYGIQYCLAEQADSDKTMGTFDILVKYSDAAKVNRVAERLHLAEIQGSINTNVSEKEQQKAVEITEAQKLMNELFSPNKREREEREGEKQGEHQEAVAGSPSEASYDSTAERMSIREILSVSQNEIENTMNMFSQARGLRESMMSGISGFQNDFPGWNRPAEDYNEAGERLYRGKTAAEMTADDQVQYMVDEEMSLNGKLSENLINQLYMNGYKVNNKGIVEHMQPEIPGPEKKIIADMMRNPGEPVKSFEHIKEAFTNG